jgi:hypothetical protein
VRAVEDVEEDVSELAVPEEAHSEPVVLEVPMIIREETPQDVTLAPIDLDDEDEDEDTIYSDAIADLRAASGLVNSADFDADLAAMHALVGSPAAPAHDQFAYAAPSYTDASQVFGAPAASGYVPYGAPGTPGYGSADPMGDYPPAPPRPPEPTSAVGPCELARTRGLRRVCPVAGWRRRAHAPSPARTALRLDWSGG